MGAHQSKTQYLGNFYIKNIKMLKILIFHKTINQIQLIRIFKILLNRHLKMQRLVDFFTKISSTKL